MNAFRPFAHPFAKVSLFLCAVAAANFDGIALGQGANSEGSVTPLLTEPLGMTGWRNERVAITTQMLGMTGWRPDPITTITTPTLGMTGWRREPVTIRTQALAMTGWDDDPITIDTHVIGLVGWRRDPSTLTIGALGMTGWAAALEQCDAPFLLDEAKAECICAPGLLPVDGDCVAANFSPPHDLRVEIDGSDSCEVGETCEFDIVVTNIGAGPFRGLLSVFVDVNLSNVELSTSSNRWSCKAGSCVHPTVTFAPGSSEALVISAQMPIWVRRDFRLEQCAELKSPRPGDEPIRFVQLMLTSAGIDVGPPDNRMGRKTRAGIATFRRTLDLPGGTEIDESLITALKGLMPADQQPDNDRACVEVPVIR